MPTVLNTGVALCLNAILSQSWAHRLTSNALNDFMTLQSNRQAAAKVFPILNDKSKTLNPEP